MSSEINREPRGTALSSDRNILAFGASNSGKAEILERIRLTAEANTQDVSVPNADSNGIKELQLTKDGVVYRILDAGTGPSPSETPDVTAIMFVFDIAPYNQPNLWTSRTPMEADNDLFTSVANSPALSTAPIILFLNNADEFKRNISIPVHGNSVNDNATADDSDTAYYSHLSQLCTSFASLSPRANDQIYTHVTSKADTKDLEFLTAAVQDILAQASERVSEEWTEVPA